ncbi:MAG: sensor histidine kinase [Gammaproteobacteria bacterium]|nr:MAG: sensor histidine kinase [Gammaproteobacteria bacterium]
MVHFVKQYLSLLNIIKEHNKNLEIIVDERTQEIRDMQEELVESKKMASLAGLVNGVAHEINTPLGACITAASHLETQISNTHEIQSPDINPESNNDSKLKPIINLITSNLENIAALVDTFKLTATNQGSEEEKIINLSEFLNQSLMQEKIRCTSNSINLIFEVDNDIQITTYPQILFHIISSIIDNSFTHAFENVMHEKIITISAEHDADSVEISISDNGIGMKESNLNEIFDPFYTTKRGQGHHGLGLHISYNIIKHKLLGKICCSSEIDKGTTTIISLPVDIMNKD